LTLLQTTFLVHFGIFGFIPNITFLLVILINLFERPKDYSGIILSLIGGALLDIYSSRPIGFYIIILLASSLLIKFAIRRYVRIPLAKTA
jgi:rod shape-determining protein MreD